MISEYLLTQENKYFDTLYNRYKDKIYGKCLSMLSDPELCQDALQDIFIKVLLNLSTFKKDSKFSTWLYSITYNYCIDVIRKDGKLMTDSIDDTKAGNQLADINNIEEQKLLEIKVERLDKILDAIPVKDKSILIMKYQGDLSVREISDMLGKSESAVKMILKRAKEKSLRIYDEMYTE
ncbi:MAG: sigma-70 family RNA polymerase sigma factor [Saprospiraceae bacterium]|nr:sigma-70 family RNA polymerase sigma factor [Saprospiraceae bacterium]